MKSTVITLISYSAYSQPEALMKSQVIILMTSFFPELKKKKKVILGFKVELTEH